MGSAKFDLSVSIGGAAGQGIATPGNILARIVARRGLYLYAYNAYQSIVRGGHIFLTVRISDHKLYSHGDRLDLLVCLNQDTMDRHLGLMGSGSRVIFNSDTITPGPAGDGALMCPMPVAELSEGSRNKLIQNTISLGVMAFLLGMDFQNLEDALTLQLQRKGQDTSLMKTLALPARVSTTPPANFDPYPEPIPNGSKAAGPCGPAMMP